MNPNSICPHCLKEVENIEGVQLCPHCEKDMHNISEIQHQLKPQTILAGKYLIGDVIGEGGFGITYVGLDLNLEMRVAIKEFYPNGYATREANTTTALTVYSGSNQESVQKWRDGFIKEARSLAKCSNLSGVVGVKDFFQENNTAYIILEYLEGTTLKNYVKEHGGKVSVDWLLSALGPVIVSLGEVHKGGLIHRDISPDNIMLLPDGSMKLIDFGAARDYAESGEKSLSVMLKPGYAPEEQYRSKGVQGPWSDVYAIAGTIYRCITGITPIESMERIRKDELKPPSELGIVIDKTVETALMKGFAVFAEDRYQNIEEFHKDLYESSLLKGAAVEEPIKCDAEDKVQQFEVLENKNISENVENNADKTKKIKMMMAIVTGLAACIFMGILIGTGSNKIKKDTEIVTKDVTTEDVMEESIEEIVESQPKEDSIALPQEQIEKETIQENETTSDGYIEEQKTMSNDHYDKELTIEETVNKIRDVYYDIQNNLDKMTEKDGGGGTTRYVEDDGTIRKIVANVGTYSDSDYSSEYAAEYYYDENEELKFVFVYKMGEEHRFYVDQGNCIRYIDVNSVTYDYQPALYGSDVNELGNFIEFGISEINVSHN